MREEVKDLRKRLETWDEVMKRNAHLEIENARLRKVLEQTSDRAAKNYLKRFDEMCNNNGDDGDEKVVVEEEEEEEEDQEQEEKEQQQQKSSTNNTTDPRRRASTFSNFFSSMFSPTRSKPKGAFERLSAKIEAYITQLKREILVRNKSLESVKRSQRMSERERERQMRIAEEWHLRRDVRSHLARVCYCIYYGFA